jgi:hypothetical protein
MRILLPGLLETNLSGYLAGCGVLRLVSLTQPEATLKWDHHAILEADHTPDSLVDALYEDRGYGFSQAPFMTQTRQAYQRGKGVKIDKETTLDASKMVPFPCDILAKVTFIKDIPCVTAGFPCPFPKGVWPVLLAQARAVGQQSIEANMVGLRVTLDPEEDAKPAVSYLVRLPGKGGRYVLKTIKELTEQVGRDKIRRDLFDPWTYSDPKLGLGLDDREGNDKGSNPKPEGYTNHGANLLILHGLSYFPCFDYKGEGRTMGIEEVSGKGSRKERVLVYPVWRDPLSYDTARYFIWQGGLGAQVQRYRVRTVSRGKGTGKVTYMDIPFPIQD